MTTETIFNPKDETIKERFDAFEYVNKCYKRDKENLNSTTNFLGEKDEIKEAYQISRNSLKQAHHSISEDDLKKAYNNGLLNNEQIKNFKQSKNLLEAENQQETILDKKHQSESGHQL